MQPDVTADQATPFHAVTMKQRAAMFAHYWRLRLQGHRFATRYAFYWLNPASRLAADLGDIKHKLGLKTFGRALDFGCHVGRLTSAIRANASEVWGADLFSTVPAPVDKYIQVKDQKPGNPNYFPEVADATLDTIIVPELSGWPPGQEGNWAVLFSATEDRLNRFLTPGNFHRLIRPGGLLIITANESAIEKRVGKRGLTEIERDIETLYPHPTLDGFSFVMKGVCKRYVAPFIVYRRS